MSFVGGCLLVLDGILAGLFLVLFLWLQAYTFALVGAGILAIPIWVFLARKWFKKGGRARKVAKDILLAGLVVLVVHLLDLGSFALNGIVILAVLLFAYLIRKLKEKREEKAYQRQAENDMNRSTNNQEVSRYDTICTFSDGINEEDFYGIVMKIIKPIKRVNATIDGAEVNCTVTSQSGITTWDFTLDFNDYGHLTGDYWITSWENRDSEIPRILAERISQQIQNKMEQIRTDDSAD